MQITYAWELGGNLGHFAAAEPVLARLHRAGHQITICSPHGSDRTLRQASFPFRWLAAPKRFAAPQARTLLGHASILRDVGGFYDESNLQVLLANWRAIFSAIGSDVVLCDFAPAAMLAANTLEIPRVVFDTGFFSPPEHEPLPVLDPARADAPSALRREERSVVSIVNTCLRKLNAREISTFDALLRAQDALLVNQPALDCFARSDRSRFVGPVLRFRDTRARGALAGAKPGERPSRPLTIFAYLSAQFEWIDLVLDVLAGENEWTSTVFLGQLGESVDLERRQRPNVRLTRDAAEFERRIGCTDVVICHGGNGTINHALAHGVPVVLLPMFREQELNAEQVRGLGLGEIATGDAADALARAIARVGTNERVRQRAAAHARRMQPADIGALATRVVNAATARRSALASGDMVVAPVVQHDEQVLDTNTLDVVFLSYDEANADEHFERLRASVPHAQRVHAVPGIARAHREAARRARTERFIMVDADTIVDDAFFRLRAQLPPTIAYSSLGWSSVNAINGLAYGNGGVKVWRRDHLCQLSSLEGRIAVGALRYCFGFHAGYSQFSRCVGTTFPNGSPSQAFRAGFREAVKLGRDGYGRVMPVSTLLRRMSHINVRRLIAWLCAGADATNGLWCILGARMGLLANFDPAFDPLAISDFGWLEDVRQAARAKASEDDAGALQHMIAELGDTIRLDFGLTALREWDATRSRQFKAALAARRTEQRWFETTEVAL
jgi:UDP:flavonoid glycosyltransferase YjiC (YdhE family)